MFSFDLQRFGGGKGGVTYNTTSYEPTPYELALQKMQVQFTSDCLIVNATDLNNIAKNILVDTMSIGDEAVDVGLQLAAAITRYDDAYKNLYDGASYLLSYFGELENKSADFETINADFIDGLVAPWDASYYKDISGAPLHYPGFFEYAAHLLYDNAENGMVEIGDTMRTVVQNVYDHFQDIIRNYYDGFTIEMDNYKFLVDVGSDTSYQTFETAATLSAYELDNLKGGVGNLTKIYINASNILPAEIERAANSANFSLNDKEDTITSHAKTNYKDLEIKNKKNLTFDSICAKVLLSIKPHSGTRSNFIFIVNVPLCFVKHGGMIFMLNVENAKLFLASIIGKTPPLIADSLEIVLKELDRIEGDLDTALTELELSKKSLEQAKNELKNFGVDESVITAKVFLSSLPSLSLSYDEKEKNFIEKLDAAVNVLRQNPLVWYGISDFPHEIWRDVVGYENFYKISNYGRVKSLFAKKALILSQASRKKATQYIFTSLRKNGKSEYPTIHRLVAKAFLPNPENKPEVNHKNGVKNNNCVWNLEWVTHDENQKHAAEFGLKRMGELTDEQAEIIRRIYESRNKKCNAAALAEIFNVSPDTIYSIIAGRSYKPKK